VASHNEGCAWGFPVDLPGLPNNEVSLINNVLNAPRYDTSTLLSSHSTRVKETPMYHGNASLCRNPAVRRHTLCRIFQTANHAKVLWDPKVKPRGLFGGHLNIRSVVAKSELSHLLSNSNLDFLCISETWLQHSSSSSVFIMPGYQCFRRDRSSGRGGGVLIYVKDGIKCERLMFNSANDLEFVGLKMILSPQMSFIFFMCI